MSAAKRQEEWRVFCPKCGTQLQEGGVFCPRCGTRVVPPAVSGQQAAGPGYAAGRRPGATVRPRRKPWLWIGLAVGLAVLLVLGAAAFFVLGGGLSRGRLVYLSDDTYSLQKSLGGNSVEFDRLRGEESRYTGAQFSEDGRYFYYFSKMEDQDIGTLCRVRLDKVHSWSRAEDLGEIVDTNVCVADYLLLSDNSVVYLDGDGNLKYYRDGQIRRLARNVGSLAGGLSVSEDETRVIYLDSDRTLYAALLNDTDPSRKLAENVESFYHMDSYQRVVYTTGYDVQTGLSRLYSVDMSGNTELLGEKVDWRWADGNQVYFAASNGDQYSLYDYVSDPYVDQDAGVVRPVIGDYREPIYGYRALGRNEDPAAYTELYTSCTKGLNLFFYGWDSMEDVVQDPSYSEATRAAVQDFIDRYGATADSEGYIPVTDEVRSALQGISATLDNGTESEWAGLCFGKVETGSTVNYDRYNQALDAYNAAGTRVELRQQLQSEKRDVRALYVYDVDTGTRTLLADNLFLCEERSFPMVACCAIDSVTDKPDLDQIQSVEEVEALLEEPAGPVSFYDCGQRKIAFSMAGETFADASYVYLSGSNVLVFTDGQELLMSPVTGGQADSFRLMAEGALPEFQTEEGDVYYYINQYEDAQDIRYGDYYRYSGGRAECLAQDAQFYCVTLYEDGSKMVETYAGRNEDGAIIYEAELIGPLGKTTYLGDAVTQVRYLGDGQVCFLDDGDLCLWNGWKTRRLAQDVQYFWYDGELANTVNRTR